MDNIPAYIRRKHGQEAVTYLHPLLEPYLDKTYGIFVYQEDIMAAAIALGGFTGPEADTLGYAIRKKKSAVLRSMRQKFVTQAAEKGVNPATIDAVFKAFEPFERYGFNKAHATCYGLVAYQTAYLKANYPVDYMAAVLTAVRDSADRVAAAVAECRRVGIEIRPPDVHRSGLEFTVEGDTIRFGLLAVKNVGQGAIESIIAARESAGAFRSLTDFCTRIDTRLANKRVLESLAKVGALNAFGHPAQIIEGLDDALAAGQATQRDRASGQTSLFDLAADDGAALERPLPQVSEEPVRRRLAWEKELLGLYLSDHPLGDLGPALSQYVNAWSGDLRDESLDGQRVVVGGIVTGFRTIVTKQKQTMAVATLEDLQGSLEVIVFPRLYEQTAPTWQEGAILLVAGRVDHKGDESPLLADLVADWEAASVRGPEAFAREVAAGDRGRGRRPGGPGPARPGGYATGNGNGNGNGTAVANGSGGPASERDGAPSGDRHDDPGPGGGWTVPAGRPASSPASAAPSPGIPAPTAIPMTPSHLPAATFAAAPVGRAPAVRVSPLRSGEAGLPRIVPAEPIPTYAEPDARGGPGSDRDDEPALPDEARNEAAAAASLASVPLEAAPGRELHVRFSPAAGFDRTVLAMEAFKAVLKQHPGSTPVFVHVPAVGALPIQLRGVAFDAELVAEVRRRLGPDLVEIQLA